MRSPGWPVDLDGEGRATDSVTVVACVPLKIITQARPDFIGPSLLLGIGRFHAYARTGTMRAKLIHAQGRHHPLRAPQDIFVQLASEVISHDSCSWLRP
jgi:hypothetical protein